MWHLTRRSALLGLASAVTVGRASLAWADAAIEQRFVVVIQRGAMDGLAAVVPHGDPAFTALRGKQSGLLDLGGFYGLHPALTKLHTMYLAGEMLAVHAVAGPYRVRSHFEAQDCLESGADHRMSSGWLNRAVAALPSPAAPRAEGDALAVGIAVPLLLHGRALVGSWAPHALATPEADVYARIAALSHGDAVLGPVIAEGLRERGFSTAALVGQPEPQNRFAFPALANAAGEMLRALDGPRIAALEIGGWDTHAAQAPRLATALGQLDAGLAALQSALGATWRQTAVLVITEFGRTVRINGTKGTDHGTGTVAFVLGGAVAGGRIVADWPGLGPGKLFEDRDLLPTADLRSVAKGVLAQHLGLPPPALAQVFPDSLPAAAMRGLIRA